jgi:hypothetical protein
MALAGAGDLATLAAGQRLGGTGAFSADGRRIALLQPHGCAVGCPWPGGTSEAGG